MGDGSRSVGGGKDSRKAGEKVNGERHNKRAGEGGVGVKGEGRNLVLFCGTNQCVSLLSFFLHLLLLIVIIIFSRALNRKGEKRRRRRGDAFTNTGGGGGGGGGEEGEGCLDGGSVAENSLAERRRSPTIKIDAGSRKA